MLQTPPLYTLILAGRISFHELENGHRGRVAYAWGHLDDARISARSLGITGTKCIHQLLDDGWGAKDRRRLTPSVEGASLSQRDDALDMSAHLFRLGQRSLHPLLIEYRGDEISGHGPAMFGASPQFSTGPPMPHPTFSLILVPGQTEFLGRHFDFGEIHPKGKTHCVQNIPYLVEALSAEVARLEHLSLGLLDKFGQ